MLPIANYKEEIVKAVQYNDFTIIKAEAGVGKSSQIPQYLAEHYEQKIVTEPRIAIAKTLARRVAEEMNATLGKEVGYKTGYDKRACPDTKILFCTDGYQLIRTIFEEDKHVNRVLMIDEVHEWTLHIEALVAVCKYLRDEWNTKVVLTSATLEVQEIANFIGGNIKVLNIPGKMYNVTVQQKQKNELIPCIKSKIREGRNVLVFAPGKKKINEIIAELSGENATVLPFYGELEWEEQQKCFENYSNSKVVVATNIAQSGITIPEIDDVVDDGTAFVKVINNGVEEIKPVDISQAEIEQRMRRCGRTKEGTYTLCSNVSIKAREKYPIPEIQRSDLSKVVLQFESIGVDTENLEFYHQPDKEEIIRSKKELLAIGALDSEGNITELGKRISKMPVNVKVARMIIEAEKYGVTEEVMVIASILEIGSLVSRNGYYSAFTSERSSDLLAELDVWNFIKNHENLDFKAFNINKRNFSLIQKHLDKLRNALQGVVEFKSNINDRVSILKSCLAGWVSQIYQHDYSGYYYKEDDVTRIIDRKSCTQGAFSSFVIGKPEGFDYEDDYRTSRHLDILRFVSIIKGDMLLELIPNKIEIITTDISYSAKNDAVEITKIKQYKGEELDVEVVYERNHPKYESLKAEYLAEEYLEKLRMQRKRREEEYLAEMEMQRKRREEELIAKSVVIEGRTYYANSLEYPVICIGVETLFNMRQEPVFLQNGREVLFVTEGCTRPARVAEVRNKVRHYRIKKIRQCIEEEYADINVTGIDAVLRNKNKLGEIELPNEGEPIIAYGFLSLNNKAVSFKVGDNEEGTKESNLEALQYLLKGWLEKNYADKKFSHLSGKKKKVLTEAEKEMKEDFYTLVRELMPSLTIENIEETMEFLEEYYKDLMA